MKLKFSAVISLVVALCVGSLNSAYAADKVSASGEMYLDYNFNLSGVEETHPNEFSISRVYVNFKSNLSDKVAMRFTTDVYKGKNQSIKYGGAEPTFKNEAGNLSLSPSRFYDAYTLRVKYAYVDFKKIIPHTKITFGLQGNLWTGMVDKAWGYRVVSKSLFDQYKVMASADFGVGATVSIPEGYGELVVQALNGNGYSKLETNPNKALAARLLITPMPKDDILKNLGLAGFAYIDKDDSDDNKLRFGGMLKFAYDIAKLTGEFGMSQDGKDETKALSFAVAAEVKTGKEGPMKNLAIIGRLDRWDKNTDKDEDETMRIIAGLSYEITKGVKAIATFQNKSHYVGGESENDQEIVAQAYIKF